ncbi:MAG: spermidine synthase, partial [Bacteroidia bacterium]
GFYLIPIIGLTFPLFIFGFLMIACSLVYFGVKNGKTLLLVSLLIAASSFLVAAKNEDVKNVIYKSEGLLGKLEVLETHWDMDSTRRGENHRILLINNIIQTWTETTTKKSYLDYVDQIEEVAVQIKKDKPKALILGLGGGAVANMLTEKGFDVTCVELDTRIAFVAKKYFALSDKVKVIEDDARHAIERMDEKFDFVLVDLFNGEVTPSHVLSNESFERLKKITTDSTLVLFNTYGYCKVPVGLGNLALLNTIKKSGYNYTIGWTGEINKEDFRNFVVVSSRTWLPTLTKEFTEKIDLNGAELITDDKPVLEFLNAKAAKRWRYYYLQSFIPGRDNAYPEEK